MPDAKGPMCDYQDNRLSDFLVTYVSPNPRIGKRAIRACKLHLPWAITKALEGKGIPPDAWVKVLPSIRHTGRG